MELSNTDLEIAIIVLHNEIEEKVENFTENFHS